MTRRFGVAGVTGGIRSRVGCPSGLTERSDGSRVREDPARGKAPSNALTRYSTIGTVTQKTSFMAN